MGHGNRGPFRRLMPEDGLLKEMLTVYRIRIKAGKQVYSQIQDGGFSLDSVSTYFAPAVGPRWLIAGGFDLTLLRNGSLGRSGPVLLAGASAGACRLAAWLQPEAEKSYLALREAYINLTYHRGDTPSAVLQSLGDVVNTYLEDDALPFVLANKKYRMAIITARARHLLASEVKWIQRFGLGLCLLLNAVRRSFLHDFVERVVFYSGAKPPSFCLRGDFSGRYVPLNEINFKHAVLASASVPLFVAGVRDIYGAPKSVYRDGGLTDYPLAQNYASAERATLFFHHQERIIPCWLDKRFSSRRPPEGVLENVLMVFPTPRFVEKLPGGKVPEREDFATFIDAPEQRMKNWRQAVDLSAPLGEEFLELVESGRIKDAVEKM